MGAIRWESRLAAVVVAVAVASGVRAQPLEPGELIIADRGSPGAAGGLFRLASGGGTPRPLVTSRPLGAATAVATDSDGTLLVVELPWERGGQLLRVDPASGAVTVLAGSPPLFFPVAVTLGLDGDPIVADLDAGSRLDFRAGSLAGTGALYRSPSSPGTGVTLLSIDCCTFNASAVTTTPTGHLVAVDLGFQVFHGDGAIARVDPVTGVIRPIATSEPLFDPSGVVASGDGTLFVTEATNPQPGPGAILAIEPEHGLVTIIATGAPITDPRGIAIDARGTLVIADSGSAAIYRVDPTTRQVTMLAAGAPLLAPYGIAIASAP